MFTQAEMSKLIISSKHSDHRVLSAPLTAAVMGTNKKDHLAESKLLIDRAALSIRKPHSE